MAYFWKRRVLNGLIFERRDWTVFRTYFGGFPWEMHTISPPMPYRGVLDRTGYQLFLHTTPVPPSHSPENPWKVHRINILPNQEKNGSRDSGISPPEDGYLMNRYFTMIRIAGYFSFCSCPLCRKQGEEGPERASGFSHSLTGIPRIFLLPHTFVEQGHRTTSQVTARSFLSACYRVWRSRIFFFNF